MASAQTKSIAVLGAGLTGLTAAHRLTRAGHRVRLFESTDRLGGAIRTVREDGWVFEAGPHALSSEDRALGALLDELGLRGDIVAANPAACRRHVVSRGRLRVLPDSVPALLLSPVFSVPAKLRALIDLLARPRVRTTDVAIGELVRSHLGQALVDYALEPWIAATLGGNPQTLSARHAFPTLWELEQRRGALGPGVLAMVNGCGTPAKPAADFSFRNGLQTLVDALAHQLGSSGIVRRARIEALVPGARWSVVWTDGTETHTEHFDGVAAALPAPALAQLRFGTLGERPLASLEAIEHPPVSALLLGFRRADVAHPLDGGGVLVPVCERRRVLAIRFASAGFPDRAPADHVGLTVLVGGRRAPELARQPAEQILTTIEPDLRELLGVRAEPVFRRHVFWPRAIPQHALGHEAHLETIARTERAHAGFLLGGQTCDGVAPAACIAAGERLAKRVGG